jgi:hypothetical protein
MRQELIVSVWISKSNPGKQAVLSVLCSVVGVVLAIGFRDVRDSGTNTLAGFLLGVLLLLVGVAGFLVSGTQTVVVDPKTRCITIEDSNRFCAKKRSIPFSDVLGISIGYLGKRSNHVTWYYLALKQQVVACLRNDPEVRRIVPFGSFVGSPSRQDVDVAVFQESEE